MTNTTQLAVKSAVDAWHGQVKNADGILDKLTDEQLMKEIAPGKNRGVYILGHLTAVHDRMLALLNLDKQQYPQLDEPFLTKPDKAVAEIPSASELRTYWKNVNTKLATHFNNLPAEGWFEKHNSVSVEDFAKEPHRNRLNVLLSRTGHLAYHVGQLRLL
ncbi:MAG TPA: DinB family protein [Bacteroidia bacterium]|nr:DinB family protein [Bacteroidia bacterium]